MGHRRLFSTSQVFESDDQNWNHQHTDQPYVHMAWPAGTGNGSFLCPMENLSLDAGHSSSQWNAAARSNGYSPLSHGAQAPHYQPDASGPSHDIFLHSSTPRTFPVASESYTYHASTSSYERQPYYGAEGSFVDTAMDNGQGPHKRKIPGIPSISDRGGTSRHYSPGSSSLFPASSELCQERSTINIQHMPWDHFSVNPSSRGNGIPIRGEASARNVRSRSALNLESNLSRTHLSSNPSYSSYASSCPIDHSETSDFPGQGSSSSIRDWNHVRVSSSHGRFFISDTSSFSHEMNHSPNGGRASSAPVEFGGHHHYFASSRSFVPQGFHGSSNQLVRGVHSNFSQRTNPIPRTFSSSLHLGPMVPSDDGLQLVAESYASRLPRPNSTGGWRNSDRNGRSRVPNERHRPLSEESNPHDRFASEGFMVVDHSALYGSTNMVDRHRDMRLDIDNMSYEELLALEERIGNVSTGLSEDLISKCVTETIYCSSDQTQEEGSCVICLEEYKDMDDVGALKFCGHDFHVSCIKKWLAMKNLCPICKTTALADHMKHK